MGEQAENIERVDARIGSAVMDFCRQHVGQRFFAEDLHLSVIRQVGEYVAPASSDRILRLKRQQEMVDYEVISRSESLYEIIGFQGEDETGMDDLNLSQRAAAVILAHPLLQTKNVRGSGSCTLTEKLAKETGISITVLRRVATVFRRNHAAFLRVQNGEISAETAYRQGSLNGDEFAEEPPPVARPLNQKEQLRCKAAYERLIINVDHLKGTVGGFKDLNPAAAWRFATLEPALSSLRRSRRLIAHWEREIQRAKGRAIR